MQRIIGSLRVVVFLFASVVQGCATTVVETERNVQVSHYAADRIPADLPKDARVTVVAQNGKRRDLPAGAVVTPMRDGLAIDAGAGAPLETVPSQEVKSVEVRSVHETVARHTHSNGTAIVVGVVVGVVTLLGVSFALADSMHFGSFASNPL